jgi:hypothetical protein
MARTGSAEAIDPSARMPLLWRLARPRAGMFQLTRAESQLVFSVLKLAASVLAILALADIAVRAAVRLELRWDTFGYHLPYAALRGGLSIPFELSNAMRVSYDGFPPLPHFVQGVLWRLTGSMNATGVVNYLAFVGFLTYSQRALRAPFWLVTLISLTAPLVIIHASTSYIDLFGNSFLAAGACSCLYVFLFPDTERRSVFVGGLMALAAAAWCKYTLVPIVAPLLASFGCMSLYRPRCAGFGRARAALLCAATAALASTVYVKNLVVFGNPFWPLRVPFIGHKFPYLQDAMQNGLLVERPAKLRDHAQPDLFFRSLFEIGMDQVDDSRPRWIIDQGDSEMFRMGGFWGMAAAFYLLTLLVLLVSCHGRRGWVASGGMLAVLALVAFLPQSHELRYYLFIPLSGAATLGMLLPRFKEIAPQTSLALLSLVIALFLHMAFENWEHYRIERIGQAQAAQVWGADARWPQLERGKSYCAVDMVPMAFLLTGPTLSEYHIVDRERAELCPAGSQVIER